MDHLAHAHAERTTPPGSSAAAQPAPGVAAALAAYLGNAPPAFVAQADVQFVAAAGVELPAHSQFLARSCDLFAELLDGEVEGRPTPASPLRVALGQHTAAEIAQTLQAVYSPHAVEGLAAQLNGPMEYGAQLDLAAFLRFGHLLEVLRAPLASRCKRMGELVGFNFAAWLEVADRHNLAALRSYCLECLLHLLVAPGCTGQPDEPTVQQLDWKALSRDDLLLLLDGLASGVRRCTHGSYTYTTRVPCSPAAAARAGSPQPAAAPAMSWAGLLPHSPAGHSTPPGTPAGALHGSAAAAETPPSSARTLLASPSSGYIAHRVTVPQLRPADICGNLPGDAAISSWRHMGDLCREA